jgi:hypothetical protein
MDVKPIFDDLCRMKLGRQKIQEVPVPQEFLLVSAEGLEPSTP